MNRLPNYIEGADMKENVHPILLQGARFSSREEAHSYLAQALALPDWYGKNLDALYDALGDLVTPTLIVLIRPELVKQNLGEYGDRLIQVLRDSAKENAGLYFRLRPVQTSKS